MRLQTFLRVQRISETKQEGKTLFTHREVSYGLSTVTEIGDLE